MFPPEVCEPHISSVHTYRLICNIPVQVIKDMNNLKDKWEHFYIVILSGKTKTKTF